MRAVQRRGGGAGARLAFGALVLDSTARLAEFDGAPMALSGREWEVLEALVRARRRTVHARERLQGDGSGNARGVHLAPAPAHGAAGLLIRTVRGFGYRLERSQERREGADQPPA